ncbi:hypothetical protein P4E94_08585 [Pontiellaceae bacterium B12219]|nr:hypothetical protein [Pontiellaceae bacterium B12219]
MKEIIYSCPHCHTTFSASSDRAGKKTHCWSCGKGIQIPYVASVIEEPEMQQSKSTRSNPVRNKSVGSEAAKGVLRAGWICLVVGLGLMPFFFLLPFYLYFFVASFILSIIAIAQKRQKAGLVLLFVTIFLPAITAGIFWITLLETASSGLKKALAANPQPIILPQNITISRPAISSKPVSPNQQNTVKAKPAPRAVVHRSVIPSQAVSLESLLSLLDRKAHGFQTADTSLDREEIVKSIQRRAQEAFSDYALQFTFTLKDIRRKSDGVYFVSFSDLQDGGLNKSSTGQLKIVSSSSITLKMDVETARNLQPGQKITVRAKAELSLGLFYPSNFVLDIWAKNHPQKIGSVCVQECTYKIHH